MKPADVNSKTYINIFANSFGPNWSEEDFVIKKVQDIICYLFIGRS